MRRMSRSALIAFAAITLSAGVALAQGVPKGPGPGMGGMGGMGPGPGTGPGPGMGGMGGMGGGRGPGMLGPNMMMGPGMMGMGGFGFSCNPRAAGMAEWRADRLEAVLKPNEAQKAKLAELRAASTKAAETIAAACGTVTEAPKKATERMALMEKRLDAMQQAVKLVRPAFDAFYNSLDDTQKASLESAGPRRWGWDNWRWRWNR